MILRIPATPSLWVSQRSAVGYPRAPRGVLRLPLCRTRLHVQAGTRGKVRAVPYPMFAANPLLAPSLFVVCSFYGYAWTWSNATDFGRSASRVFEFRWFGGRFCDDAPALDNATLPGAFSDLDWLTDPR